MYRFNSVNKGLENSVKPCPWIGDLHVNQSLTFLCNTYSEGVTHSFNLTIELGIAETSEDVRFLQRDHGTS